MKDVGTDKSYNETLQKFQKIAQIFEAQGKDRDGIQEYWNELGKPELAPGMSFPTEKGYAPPPLVGLWASAPYFHNGSVPELSQVLDSSTRPRFGRRSIF